MCKVAAWRVTCKRVHGWGNTACQPSAAAGLCCEHHGTGYLGCCYQLLTQLMGPSCFPIYSVVLLLLRARNSPREKTIGRTPCLPQGVLRCVWEAARELARLKCESQVWQWQSRAVPVPARWKTRTWCLILWTDFSLGILRDSGNWIWTQNSEPSVVPVSRVNLFPFSALWKLQRSFCLCFLDIIS